MKATEDDSKRSPTRRRLFGPVDHNQNKVDASLIWTNINPGFPRVDYSPRFRPRPPPLNTDSSVTEAGRDDVEMEGEGEMEGDDVAMDDGSVAVTTAEGGYGREGAPDERRSSGGIASSVQSADDDFVASLNTSRRRSWSRTAASHGAPCGDMASTSNLPSSGGRPESPSRCGSDDEGSSVVRRRRPVSEHDHSTNDYTTEETDDDDHADSSSSSLLYSGSLDPSCRTSRPATCPWRTLTSSFTDEPGRMRSASLGHTSRPSCSGSKQRFCRHSNTATTAATAEGGSRGGSPNLEPTYRKVPVVQLRGADQTTVLCPPGRTYFFKPIGGGGGEGGGEEDSPALTASQSPDEGGRDDESSGGTTRGSIGDPSRLQRETGAEKDKKEEKEEEEEDGSLDGSVVCEPKDVIGVDDSRLGPEVVEEEEEEDDRCPLPQQQQQQQQQQQSSRRRRQSMDETDVSLEREDEDEDEVAGHDCSDRKARNDEEENEGRAAAAAVDRGRDRLSGRRIKDKLVTSPPKAKKRKPYEDGNSDSSY